ncbi:ribosomal RNA large subunit methyltransferase J [Umbelopsis sp. PMI_123]|nr:ribosomal RNA large subunit methyltransferase J [Umbelopsis sp. PMI_123]
MNCIIRAQFSVKLCKVGTRLYSSSSKKWLSRQSNDIFVRDARSQQYRARSAFKLIQLNDKHRFLKRNANIIELGASPGGWTQVVAEKVFMGKQKLSEEETSISPMAGTVIAVDLLPMEPIPGVSILEGDFLANETQQHIMKILNGKSVDVVLSDMAPSFSGHHLADHARSMELCEYALAFATKILKKDGVFVCKFFMGGSEQEFRQLLRKHFETVRHEKPKASRKESAEGFFVAIGFRGES